MGEFLEVVAWVVEVVDLVAALAGWMLEDILLNGPCVDVFGCCLAETHRKADLL